MASWRTIEQRRAMARNDDATCRSYGLRHGTPEYANCRMWAVNTQEAAAKTAKEIECKSGRGPACEKKEEAETKALADAANAAANKAATDRAAKLAPVLCTPEHRRDRLRGTPNGFDGRCCQDFVQP